MTCFWVGVLCSLISCKIVKAFSVSLFITMSFDSLCPSWAITVLQLVLYTWLFILYVLWEEVSFYSPSNFVGLIEITYFSGGELGILQCPLSVQPDVHSCQNSFWGSYLNWFGDTLSILWMTLLVLIVCLPALFLFVTIEAPKMIVDLVHKAKALCEFVVLLELEGLGPY